MFVMVLVVGIGQFIVRIVMIRAVRHAFGMFLGMSSCQLLVELLMLATISHMLADLPGIAVAAVLKVSKPAVPVAAVFSTAMFVMVLVVNVVQFIVRIVMIRAARQTLGMFLGMSTRQLTVELFMLSAVSYMLANDIEIVAAIASAITIAIAIPVRILSQCGYGAACKEECPKTNEELIHLTNSGVSVNAVNSTQTEVFLFPDVQTKAQTPVLSERRSAKPIK